MVVFQVEQQTSQCAITAPCFIGPSQNCLMSFTCSIRGGAAGGILQTWIVRNRSKDFCIREISLALQLWVQESVRGCEKKWSICAPLLFRSLWTELLLHTVSNHGSSHRQNRQGVAQANWSLCCLVGAVLSSLFAYRCFCYSLSPERDSYSGWVGVSRSLQGGWLFSGVHRQGDTERWWFWGIRCIEICHLQHVTVHTVLLQLFSCPDRSSACLTQVQFPWASLVFQQTYQKNGSLSAKLKCCCGFHWQSSSAYSEENVLWRYGARTFRPVPALRLPARRHGRALQRRAAGSRSPRRGRGCQQGAAPLRLSAAWRAVRAPAALTLFGSCVLWNGAVWCGTFFCPVWVGCPGACVPSGPRWQGGVRGWKILSLVWALLSSHWSTGVLRTLFPS